MCLITPHFVGFLCITLDGRRHGESCSARCIALMMCICISAWCSTCSTLRNALFFWTLSVRNGCTHVQEHEYGFKLLPPASLRYDDVQFCPGAAEPKAADIMTLHPGLNMLLVLGTQKGGTTWLFNALMKHPAFIGARQGFRCRTSNGVVTIGPPVFFVPLQTPMPARVTR